MTCPANYEGCAKVVQERRCLQTSVCSWKPHNEIQHVINAVLDHARRERATTTLSSSDMFFNALQTRVQAEALGLVVPSSDCVVELSDDWINLDETTTGASIQVCWVKLATIANAYADAV